MTNGTDTTMRNTRRYFLRGKTRGQPVLMDKAREGKPKKKKKTKTKTYRKGTFVYKHFLCYSNVPTTGTKDNEALVSTVMTIGDVNDIFSTDRVFTLT